MAHKFAREGLTKSEMGLLSVAFQKAESKDGRPLTAEERWAEAKKVVPFCTNLDEGFKAWCFKQNGVPLPDAKKVDAKGRIDPLK